jgi:hypothetical protein
MEVIGIDGSIKINNIDAGDLIESISIKITKNMKEKKRKNSSWTKYAPGKYKDFPLSFTMDWDPSHEICRAVADSFWNNTVLTVKIQDREPATGETGADASHFVLTGNFIVESFANDQSNLEEGQTYPVDLKLAYGAADPTFTLSPATLP